MVEAGLIEEIRRLEAQGVFLRSPTAGAAIGYKELLPFVRGEASLEEGIAELKIATRRYAKRQLTWFSAKPYVNWITMDEGETMRKNEEIVKNALDIIARA